MGTKGGLDVDLYLNFLAFEDTDENKPKLEQCSLQSNE